MADELTFSDAQTAAVLRGSQRTAITLIDKSSMQGAAPQVMMARTVSSDRPFAELQILARISKEIAELSSEDATAAGYHDLDEMLCALDPPKHAATQAYVFSFHLTTVLNSEGVSAAEMWALYAAGEIPTKPTLHASFMQALRQAWSDSRILDLGCGDGRLAVALVGEAASEGEAIDWVGTDVCNDAVENARLLAERAGYPHVSHVTSSKLCAAAPPVTADQRMSFVTGDVTSIDVTEAYGLFDLVLCQLVISVVGSVQQRSALLQTAFRHLKPGGVLLLSASGASEDINSKYKALYDQDLAITGEYRTYLSRGETGQVLYMTHHFTSHELRQLLSEAGFEQIAIHEAVETSSRRKDEAARFLYAISARRQ